MFHHFIHLLEGLGLACAALGAIIGAGLHAGYARLRGTHISRKERKALGA